MGPRTRLLGLVAIGLLLGAGCRKSEESPRQVRASSSRSGPEATTTSPPVTSATAPLPAEGRAVPSAASAVAPLRVAARAPVVLDEEAKRVAKAYLTALGRGRRATLAKDYAVADEQFSKCLALLPRDPRALGERGYARLLAGKLAEAESDLEAAADAQPSTSLALQIAHNRMLVARQRGDERAAASFEQTKQQLKSARRLAANINCTLETRASRLAPEQPKNLADAVTSMTSSHARAADLKAEEVTLGNEPVPPGASDGDLWQRLTGGAPRDGAWALTTHAPGDGTIAKHLLVSRAGKLYLHSKLSLAWAGRCGYTGATELEVAGGIAEPLHATLSGSEAIVGYMCEWPDGHDFSACGSREGVDGNPIQSYCSWLSTSEQLIVFDAQTLEGLVDVSATVQAETEGVVGEPGRLLDVRFESDHLTVNACRTRRVVPYASDAP